MRCSILIGLTLSGLLLIAPGCSDGAIDVCEDGACGENGGDAKDAGIDSGDVGADWGDVGDGGGDGDTQRDEDGEPRSEDGDGGVGDGDGGADGSDGGPETVTCEILVVGGGLGGVAAAHEAASAGADTCLVARWDWLGGQASSQGVSAFDDLFLEYARPYERLREGIRDHYERSYTVDPAAYQEPGGKEPFALNPGKCAVSAVCYEPPVAASVIEQEILAPLVVPAGQSGLHVFKGFEPVEVFKSGETVTGVRFRRAAGGPDLVVHAQQTVDATELGDLLPLAGAAYRVGMEAKSETGEPDAENPARPDCVQPFTYTFVLERRPESEDNRIPEPPDYDPGLYDVGVSADNPDAPCCFYQGNCSGAFSSLYSFWNYRRSVAADQFAEVQFDLSMINHWSSDFNRSCGPHGCNIIDKSPAEVESILARAREFTLGYIYFIQTEACWDNNDTKKGHPHLKLRSDLMGTAHGLSMYPYIRESRRIRSVRDIFQQDVMSRDQASIWRRKITTRSVRTYPDSIGIARYNFDRHRCEPNFQSLVPHTAGSAQIPLGSLIPESVDGLLAGNKNIGTTSITNGMYRLHPGEWNIGLAAGATAALAVELGVQPRAIRADDRHLRRLQLRLVSGRAGPIYWWSDRLATTSADWASAGLSGADDLLRSDPAYVAAQMLGVLGVFRGDDRPQFYPSRSLTRGQAAAVIVRAFDIPEVADCHPSFTDVGCGHPFYRFVQAIADLGITTGCTADTYCVDDPLTRAQLAVFMVRAACGPVWDPQQCPLADPQAPSYADVPSGHGFYGYIETARANGWFDGEAQGGTFDPDADTTRRAAALWLWERVRDELGL